MKSLQLFYVLLFIRTALADECKQLVSSEVTGPHKSVTDHEICREFASTLERKTCSGDSGIRTIFKASMAGENCTDDGKVTVDVCSGECGNDARRTVTATLSCNGHHTARCAFEYQVYTCGIEVAECILGGQCVDCRGKEVDHKFCPHEQVRKKCVDDVEKAVVTNKPAGNTDSNHRLWALIITLVVMVTAAGAALIGLAWYRYQRRNKIKVEEARPVSYAYSNYSYSSEVTMESVYDGGPGKHQDLQRVLTSVLTQQIADKIAEKTSSKQLRNSRTSAS